MHCTTLERDPKKGVDHHTAHLSTMYLYLYLGAT